MVCLPLLLATALQAVTPPERAAIYTSLQPVCDALGLSDEDGEIAARDLMVEGEPMTPASGFGDCELPDKPPAVVDCNDARASIWVHEMIGTCDMPVVFPHASLHPPAPRERGREPAAFCEGPSCSRDAVPLRSAWQGSDSPHWLALDLGAAPPSPAVARRALPQDSALPPSVLPRRHPRPPTA